jgi:DNA-damage-inducible protein D
MATNNNAISLAIFEGQNIREIWYEGRWFFSVVDVIHVLTDSADPGQYWSKMKARVKKESEIELGTKCTQLKLPASDGKLYSTDCADTENILFIIQYVPSKKAVPFKQWLAQVGNERIEEISDPDTAFEEWRERAIRSFMAQGRSEGWARNRVDSIVARNRLTGEWAVRGIKQEEYPILTDRMHMGTFDISIEEHKELKGYPVIRRGNRTYHKGDLRPGMTPMELAVATFAENVTRALHIEHDSQGFSAIAQDVDTGARIARDKRLEIEHETGRPVVSATNMLIERDGGLWGLLPSPDDA